MKSHWIFWVALACSLQGCGRFAVTRQVVVPPSTLDDYRSPAWVIRSVPVGAKMLTEDSDN